MARLAKIIVLVTALYMAFAVLWNGARDPYLGLDLALYGAADRPAELIGKAWPAEEMSRWSEQFNVDVVATGTPADPGKIVGFPAHSGSTFDQWLRDGYPCLRAPCVTRVLSLKEHPESLRDYEVGVSSLAFIGPDSHRAAGVARNHFEALGWRVGIQELNGPRVWLAQFRILFLPALSAVVLLLFFLAAGHTLARSKEVGVHVLHGKSRPQVAVAHCLTWVVHIGAGFAVVELVALAVFWLLWQGHFFVYFTVFFAVLTVGLSMTAITGLLLGHYLLSLTSVVEAINGKLRFGPSIFLVYIARSMAILAVGVLSLSLAVSAGKIAAGRSLLQNMGSLDAYSSYGVNTGATDDKAVARQAAAQLTPLFRSGELLLTRCQPSLYYQPADRSGIELRSQDTALVLEANGAYLADFPRRFVDGRQMDPERDLPDSEMSVLFPEGTPTELKENIRAYISNLLFSNGSLGHVDGWVTTAVPVREFEIQRGSTSPCAMGSLVNATDPIIVVFPSQFELGEDFVFGGGGRMLLKTSDIDHITSVAPAFHSGVAEYRSLKVGLEQEIPLWEAGLYRGFFELGVYAFLLPLSAIAIALMYSRQNKQRIAIQGLSGRPFREMWPLLVILDAVSLVAVLWAARPTEAATVDQLTTLGALALGAPTLRFATVVAVLALVFAVQYSVLYMTQRRLVMKRSAA
ncbi:hypothetical protein [Austwickia chelonae]|uniref:hypothetical protein n=1 Tax=Austwickia chelonae TaxID=100225 RepID=UPI000E239437|nr:hypothetical protein [Austwickia chelonae]